MEVKNIQDAVIQPSALAWHGITYQATLYKSYIPKLPDNMFQKVMEYDQHQDPSCVVFGMGALIGYNTGLTFTNGELRELWQEHQGYRGGDPFKTGRELGQRFILNSFPIYIDTPEFKIVTAKKWAVWVEIWCNPIFLNQWLETGKITEVQPVHSWRRVFRHFMVLYIQDGRTYLHNSWEWLKAKGYHNIYDITTIFETMVAMKIIRPYGMLILPYSQDIHPWMKIAMKDYTRAIKRAGMSVGDDIWATFKKLAGIDGKVDKR